MIEFLGRLAFKFCIFAFIFIIVFIIFIGKFGGEINNLNNVQGSKFDDVNLFDNNSMFESLDREMEKLIRN
ncbi:MAG: hypothetical protein WCZ27_02290 [Tissierellaceae bacterium]